MELGSECWAAKIQYIHKMSVVEMQMLDGYVVVQDSIRLEMIVETG